MHRRSLLRVAVLVAGVIAMGGIAPVLAGAVDKGYRITGPYTHDNLAIYLIHRRGGKDGPVPLTLGEALGQGRVKVIETGNVEELFIRNLGDREVFIQAGDIVKGGKQDRVLTVSMIVPPNSGDVPVGAFCVEQGRWSGRGLEKTAEFSASTARLVWKDARIALARRAQQETASEPARPEIVADPAQGDRERRWLRSAGLQAQVWYSVREVQASLGQALKLDVADQRSRSSLQLSLENTALASALKGYEAALGKLTQKHPDAVGHVFAINGEIDSGDEFGSAGLFRKLWPRQLKAAATEAVARDNASIRQQPAVAQVAAFLDEVRAAKVAGKPMPGRMRLETRETEKALYTEVRSLTGLPVHRSFIAR